MRPARGSRAAGKAYERRFGRELARLFGRALGEVVAGQWIRFVDRNGPGHAQPDFYVVRPDRVLVFECKLKETEAGVAQLEGLYAPLLAKLYEPRAVVKVLVFKFPTRGRGLGIEAIPALAAREVCRVHWLG